jgi:2-iminobutanoate/2-iminopropanoate deaminase
MNSSVIHSDGAPNPVGPYSQAIMVNGFLFLSGQIGIIPETGEVASGGVIEETRQAFKNIEAILAKANFTFKNVIRVDLYLKHMSDYASVNELYAKIFGKSLALPARTTVEVSNLPKNALVEITCTAA